MKKKTRCTICNKSFDKIIDLGKHPCADTFLSSKKEAEKLPKFPLQVGFCKCSHLTAIYNVSGYQRYQKYKYSYTSNNSPVSRSHFKNLAKKIAKKIKLNSNSFVVEAGSNDGTFLYEINKFSNTKVLGIDPSKNMAKLAKQKGVRTINDFFDLKLTKNLKKKYPKIDFFYGANVFNHVDNPINFLKAIKNLIKPNGLIILEVPDLNSLIKKIGFDTIYHEHRNYFSEKSIYKIFRKEKINIFKIEKIKYMAGSLRIFANLKRSNIKPRFKNQINLSNIVKFEKNIKTVKERIIEFISRMKIQKKDVAAVGAATKGNTLLNYCDLSSKEIKFILENSKYKINKYTPGSCIKIVDEKLHKNYQALLILPWNITNHLLKKFVKNSKKPYVSIQKIVKKISNSYD